MVMISGYRSKLYAKLLEKWRVVEIRTMTHGGPRVEIVWCNFPEPSDLHDPRFAGADYRQRENIARKKKRIIVFFVGKNIGFRRVDDWSGRPDVVPGVRKRYRRREGSSRYQASTDRQWAKTAQVLRPAEGRHG